LYVRKAALSIAGAIACMKSEVAACGWNMYLVLFLAPKAEATAVDSERDLLHNSGTEAFGKQKLFPRVVLRRQGVGIVEANYCLLAA
jgi:hypothetical protein